MQNDSSDTGYREQRELLEKLRTEATLPSEHERIGAALERLEIVRWLNARAAVYGRSRAQHNGPGGSGDLQNVIEGLAAAIERGSHRAEYKPERLLP